MIHRVHQQVYEDLLDAFGVTLDLGISYLKEVFNYLHRPTRDLVLEKLNDLAENVVHFETASVYYDLPVALCQIDHVI